MRILPVLSCFLLLAASLAAEPADFDAALENLDSEDFPERQAAYKKIRSAPFSEFGLGKKMLELSRESDSPEISRRAAVLADWLVHGLHASSSQESRQALQDYLKRRRKLKPAEHSQALRPLEKFFRSGDIDEKRFLAGEFFANAPSRKVFFAERLAALLFRENREPTAEETAAFASMVNELSEDEALKIYARANFLPLYPRFLDRHSDRKQRLVIYQSWSKKLMDESFHADFESDPLYAAILASFEKEPLALKQQVATSGKFAIIAAPFLLEDLPIDQKLRHLLLEKLTVAPAKKMARHNSCVDHLARAILMWGDESTVPLLLDKVISKESAFMMQALAAQALRACHEIT